MSNKLRVKQARDVIAQALGGPTAQVTIVPDPQIGWPESETVKASGLDVADNIADWLESAGLLAG